MAHNLTLVKTDLKAVKQHGLTASLLLTSTLCLSHRIEYLGHRTTCCSELFSVATTRPMKEKQLMLARLFSFHAG